jgi:AbrB family looped-hinge helix DNA binding protein
MEQVIRGKVSAGRVVLPAELRKAFGIEDGAEVVFSRTEHGIEIRTLDEAIRQAQALCAKYMVHPAEARAILTRTQVHV